VSLAAGALDFYVNTRGLDLIGWLVYLHTLGVHVSRLDVAYDDMDGRLTYENVYDSVRRRDCATHFKTFMQYGDKELGYGDSWTLYAGVRPAGKGGRRANSETVLRIYNKGAESKSRRDGSWVRVETQFTGDRAQAVFDAWAEADFSARVACEVLRSVVDFKEHGETDTNKSRWDMAAWWCDFLSDVVTRRVTVRVKRKTVRDVANWLLKQCATGMALVEQGLGGGTVWDILMAGSERLTARHRAMLEAEPPLGEAELDGPTAWRLALGAA